MYAHHTHVHTPHTCTHTTHMYTHHTYTHHTCTHKNMYSIHATFVDKRVEIINISSYHIYVILVLIAFVFVAVVLTLLRYYYPRAPQQTKIPSSQSPDINQSSAVSIVGASPKGQLLYPLPDIFVGVSALLCGCDSDEERRLMRYIVAYGGDVCSCVEEGPTHVACHSMEDIPEVCVCVCACFSLTVTLHGCLIGSSRHSCCPEHMDIRQCPKRVTLQPHPLLPLATPTTLSNPLGQCVE